MNAKTVATLRARCALVGVVLTESTNDRGEPVYVVSEGSWCRQVDDLDTLARWIDMRTGMHSITVAA